MENARVQKYVAAEFARERLATARQRGTLWGLSLHKVKEFYWTVTRLLGLAYLHDGSRVPRVRLRRADEGTRLFSVPEVASHTADPGKRLLIDVSDTAACSYTTGIQRVVRRLSRAAMAKGIGSPVVIRSGRLLSFQNGRAAEPVEIGPGDKFVMADVSWNDVAERQSVMQEVSRRGGENILILHDLIPLMHPELYPRDFYPNMLAKYEAWFDRVVANCDAVIAVSEHVAEDFRAFAAERRINPDLWVDWNHLGGDLEIGNDAAIARDVAALCRRSIPFFLSVETLEPRKGLSLALDALDVLWADGADVAYVIAGRYGNCARALQHRIRCHPEYGRRLFWFDRASDADLRQLYLGARSLVFASVVEGFGLPLVEAAHFGLPVIASDIPVFREIGGEHIFYFDVADSQSLAACLRAALAAPKGVNSMPFLTWRVSTDNLLAKIRRGADQYAAVKLCA